MTINTAFAWLEVPSSALGNSFSKSFTLSFTKGAVPDGDNVTPPHPKNQAVNDPPDQGVALASSSLGGTFEVSPNSAVNSPFRVAAGPLSEASNFLTTSNGTSWSTDEDLLVIVVKYKA